MKPVILLMGAACCSATHVLHLSPNDLTRAYTSKPGSDSAVAASSPSDVFPTISKYVAKNVKELGGEVVACEDLTHTELDEITNKVHKKSVSALMDIYKKRNDNRAFISYEGTDESVFHSEAYNMTRDGKCAQAVMMWAHHIPYEARETLISEGLRIPLMPKVSQTERKNPTALYKSQASCGACHASPRALETKKVNISQKDLIRAYTSKPGSDSAVAASSPSDVFPTISKYVAKNVKELGGEVVACEDLTHTELDEITNKVHKKSVSALMDIYKKRNDNRAFISYEGTDESVFHSEAYNMTRDGKCAQAVMMWAHHIPYEARETLISEGLRIPLMPKVSQTEQKNPTALYKSQASCGACHASPRALETKKVNISQKDLIRAYTSKPGSDSAVAASSPSDVFPTISKYVAKNVKELGGEVVACEDLTHTELDEITNKVHKKSVSALMDIYKKRNDNRAFISYEGTDESVFHSEAYNMTRDGKCAQAVMMWAHHIPYEARETLISEGLRIPLMPKVSQTERKNPTALYKSQASCGACHASPRALETKKVNISQKDLIRAYTSKPGSDSAVAASSPSDVFPTISKYVAKNVKELGGEVVACEDLTHTELDEITNKVHKKSVSALMDIYKKRNDNRAFISYEGTDESVFHSEAYNMTRDGKCAQAVMMWAHHIPYEARETLISEGLRIPLMPKVSQTEQKNPTALYKSQASCGACHASPRALETKKVNISQKDLIRAYTSKPGSDSAVAASSPSDVFPTISKYVAKNVKELGGEVVACEDLTHTELDEITNKVHKKSVSALMDIYKKRNDNRAFISYEGTDESVFHSEAYNMTRDGKCAQAVMMWAHHIPYEARETLISEGLRIPLMPKVSQTERKNPTALYKSQASCGACHASPRALETKKVNISQKDLTRAYTSKPAVDSSLAASSPSQVFSTINNYVVKNVKELGGKMVACEDLTHTELDEITNKVHKKSVSALMDIYKKRNDNRAFISYEGTDESVFHSEAYNMTRDGKCAQAVMMWAHHIPYEARETLISEGLRIPLMPKVSQTERKNPTSLYKAQVSCGSCHYTAGAPGPFTDKTFPRWGGNDSVTEYSVKVNMTDISDSPKHPKWEFLYYYNDDIKAERYEHAAGQDDEVCVHIAGVKYGQPCNVIFSSDGWSYISSPESGCCKCAKGKMGAVRSDWLRDGTAKALGNTTINGRVVKEWFKQGASDNHYYTLPNAAQTPVRFMEHKNGILKQWDFLVDTYAPGPQPSLLFQKPENCNSMCRNPYCM